MWKPRKSRPFYVMTRCQLTLVGRGGVGKTVMVCRLLKALERGHLPDDLGAHAGDGIVYLSPVGARSVSAALGGSPPSIRAAVSRLG